MSKFNSKKQGFDHGIVAGQKTVAAGKYSDYELLRRVTLTNLLFESNYYQNQDQIMTQIEELVPKVAPEDVLDLVYECRFEQNLRHTPLWLLILVHEYHQVSVAHVVSKVCSRPDMLIDLLLMYAKRQGRTSLTPIPKSLKKGMALAFDNYDDYQIAKYKKNNMDVSLVDIVNLVHPKPVKKNRKALKQLVNGTLKPADTWESNLSSGKDKKETFERLVEENKLGSLAILRNLRNMKEAGVSRTLIKKSLSQVRSKWLTPLNFLAAARIMPEYTSDINQAMQNCFAGHKIPGTTIVAIDVSGSMGDITSSYSNFNRMDVAFSLAALAGYIFEDVILVMTAGDDMSRRGRHTVWPDERGLGIFNDFRHIRKEVGGGGIFTYQLCEWLKKEGYAKDADRLVVISDSQDIDVSHGRKVKPDTSPYDTSYIIDISHHTHGIKTGVWTAEINGWSDKIFHYIAALEYKQI